MLWKKTKDLSLAPFARHPQWYISALLSVSLELVGLFEIIWRSRALDDKCSIFAPNCHTVNSDFIPEMLLHIFRTLRARSIDPIPE